MNPYPTIKLKLPEWVSHEVGHSNRKFTTVERKMNLAIKLSERNIIEGTGGPFGACIFEIKSGKLVAPGVNIVVPSNSSIAHAEAMAVMVAQQMLGTFDLGADGLPEMELVTSSQPCIQCFGVLWWSGLRRVTFGATGEDVENLTGFQEGPLPSNWVTLLRNRFPLKPVDVIENVLRYRACMVLRRYYETGGFIYNPHSDKHIPETIESVSSLSDTHKLERL